MSGIKTTAADSRKCRLCGEEKPLTEFGRWPSAADGYAFACRPCYRQYRLDWANKNRERKQELERRFYERHAEGRREKNRNYSKTHRAERNATQARRRARRRGSLVESYDRDEIYRRDRGCCHICGLRVGPDFQLDHLIPIGEGGEDTARNVAVAHASCNHKRGRGRLPAQLRLIG